MQLTYLGHSCFRLVRNGFALILDPYQKGSVPGLKPLKETANQVICSHRHADHFAFREIRISQTRADTPFIVEFIPTWHDGKEGALRGENNIAVIDVYDHKIVHMGDIGCDLTDEQLKKINGCDILLMPAGGYYTLEPDKAAELTERIAPKTVIPMHYRGDGFGYDEIATVEPFIDALVASGYELIREGSTVTPDLDSHDQDKKIILMTPQNI